MSLDGAVPRVDGTLDSDARIDGPVAPRPESCRNVRRAEPALWYTAGVTSVRA